MASLIDARPAKPSKATPHDMAARTPPTLTVLTIFTGLLMLGALYMAFIYAPTEQMLGAVQRIFYFHIGAAWAGALAFGVTMLAGIAYLITRNMAWDRVGLSAAEVGLALLTMTLVSGPVVAKYAWGRAWVWDAKLTSTAVMWLLYAAYLMLRRGVENPAVRARFAAVYGVLAFSSVIMTFFGVSYAATGIQPAVSGTSDEFGMASRMAHAMRFNFVAFTFLFATGLWHRLRLEELRLSVEMARHERMMNGG